MRWLSIALAVAMLVALVFAVRDLDWRGLLRSTPSHPLFWLAFAASYLVVPGFEWVIYRRLWQLPPGGMLPLLRKQIANELLLGYSGDAQLYLWARGNNIRTGSPAAVKDVAVLSAAAGNLATLAMMAATAPMLWTVLRADWLRALGLSVGIITLISLALFLFRRALFSLPRCELWIVFAVHMVRIFWQVALLAAMWAMLVPGATLPWLLLLATIRMMLSRLPLFPNKDALFAGVALLALGPGSSTSVAITLVAGLTIAAHAILLPITFAAGLVRRRAR
jgi:hypothetical protein